MAPNGDDSPQAHEAKEDLGKSRAFPGGLQETQEPLGMHLDSRQWAEDFGYLLGTKRSVRGRKRNIVVNNET